MRFKGVAMIPRGDQRFTRWSPTFNDGHNARSVIDDFVVFFGARILEQKETKVTKEYNSRLASWGYFGVIRFMEVINFK